MKDDETSLKRLQARIEDMCSHASVRHVEGNTFLLAIGRSGIHSIELRREDGVLLVEYWKGLPDEEEHVGDEPVSTLDEALERCSAWLLRDVGHPPPGINR